MSTHSPLPDEKLEAKAQELADRIQEQSREHFLALARLFVSKDDDELFGETEFQARDIVHRIGADAFEERLKKKRLSGE